MEKVIIAGPSSQLLAFKTAIKLGVPLLDTEFKRFPDGEVYVRIAVEEDNVLENKHVIIIHTTGASSVADQNARIMQLIMLISAAKRMKAAKVTAVIPYLAYARQDKVFRPGESTFAQVLLKTIENAGADEIYCIDLHAPHVFDALSIPAHNLNPMKYLAEYVRGLGVEDAVIVSPDKGAVERSKQFASYFGENIPVEVFSKTRDVVTGEIKMTGSLNVKGKDVIIADDIIATGGTMALAIGIAKKSGARRIYAVGTHALLLKNAVIRIMNAGADMIIGTDTVENPVALVSMADLLAENLG